jgi:hypothetical protein
MDLEGGYRSQFQSIILAFVGREREGFEKSVLVAHSPIYIRSRCILNTSLEHYRCITFHELCNARIKSMGRTPLEMRIFAQLVKFFVCYGTWWLSSMFINFQY